MKQPRIYYLLEQQKERRLTAGEQQELKEWLLAGDWEALESAMMEHLRIESAAAVEGDLVQEDRIFARVIAMDKMDKPAVAAVHRVHFLRTAWFRYAAVLLLITGTFLYLNYRPKKEIALASTEKPADILPGGNKAVLTLADGSTIVLDSVAEGELASQGETKIVKLDAGMLAYQRTSSVSGEVLYNTISTPKGGQYQVVLPDGSTVWLNAASSIRFPTTFGKDRIVHITGEVYVETAPDKNKPFRVQVKEGIIDVLGTTFNVNAYEEEHAVQTTLLEGSVQILNGGQRMLLQPGQQAYLGGNGLQRVTPDLEQVTAWKNGYFKLNNLPIETLMRQLSQWYDIEVVYPEGMPQISLEGKVKRNLDFGEMLHFLQTLGVHCELKSGRQLIVTP